MCDAEQDNIMHYLLFYKHMTCRFCDFFDLEGNHQLNVNVSLLLINSCRCNTIFFCLFHHLLDLKCSGGTTPWKVQFRKLGINWISSLRYEFVFTILLRQQLSLWLDYRILPVWNQSAEVLQPVRNGHLVMIWQWMSVKIWTSTWEVSSKIW